MKKEEIEMRTLNLAALVITLIGIVNWLLIGIFNWSFTAAVFGAGTGTRIVYLIYGIAGAWLIAYLMRILMQRAETHTHHTVR